MSLPARCTKTCLIKYDPSTVDSRRCWQGTLAEAGYDIATAPELPVYPKRTDDTSDWFQFQERITETDLRDLEMSGDHRKY